MTIDEPHDYRRHLFDKNHMHGMPDKRNNGYKSTLTLSCPNAMRDNRRRPQDYSRLA